MFRLPESSFSTRIFYSCPQVKVSTRFISSHTRTHAHTHTHIHIHIHTHKSSSSSSRKWRGNFVNLRILVKFFSPGLILDISPFWFCCIFKIQYVLSSKTSLNFHHIWFFSMSRSLSWVLFGTAICYNFWCLTVPWLTLCHCWGNSPTNPKLITAYYSC